MSLRRAFPRRRAPLVRLLDGRDQLSDPPDQTGVDARRALLAVERGAVGDAAHREGIQAYVDQLDPRERRALDKAFGITR